MDMLSVGMAFSAVCVPAVDMIIIPVSRARVIAMIFIGGIAMLSIRVGVVLFIRVWLVAVMIVPPAVMMPVARVSINPFMIPV
jgi:hypothetical protein